MDAQQDLNLRLINDLYEQGQKSAEEVAKAYKMYSMEDLMGKAKEMYDFVSKKD